MYVCVYVCMYICIYVWTRTLANMRTQNARYTEYVHTRTHTPIYSVGWFSLFLHRLLHFLCHILQSLNPTKISTAATW